MEYAIRSLFTGSPLPVSLLRSDTDVLAAVVVAFALVALLAYTLVRLIERLGTPQAPATASAHNASPIDEAERILSRRYAVGQISAEEYSRMLTILRR